jgi:hypothetical protein
MMEYNNLSFFPGLYPTLFHYGIGGFEIDSHPTVLVFKNQAKYYMSISNQSFHYHISFIFVLLNILQCRQAHLQNYFTVGKSNFDSVACKLTAVTPALLEALATKLEQEWKLVNPSPEERNALQLLQQVNTLSARIPGQKYLSAMRFAATSGTLAFPTYSSCLTPVLHTVLFFR